MNRIRTQDTAERIGRALDLVPPRIRDRFNVDIFEGDYAFAGYSRFPVDRDGNAYRDIAHYCNVGHQRGPRSARVPTVVLPQRHGWDRQTYPSVKTILHELGHALYYALARDQGERGRRGHLRQELEWDPVDRDLRWRWSYWLYPQMAKVTTYCQHEYHEQFAEAFAFWLHPMAHRASDGRLAATVFYEDARGPDGYLLGGDNRKLLAFLNELAGFPSDRRPIALR